MYTNDKPKGCTQYSPHAAGTIYMFNSSLNGPLMSNNSDFKICIKRAQSKQPPYNGRLAARESVHRGTNTSTTLMIWNNIRSFFIISSVA